MEPTELDKKVLAFQAKGHLVPTRDLIKTPEQIEGIRKSGIINTGVLDLVAKEIRGNRQACLRIHPRPWRHSGLFGL